MSRPIHWLCLSVCVLMGGAAAVAADQGEPLRKDAFGDPLPPHAIARLGSTRLTPDNAVTALAFSPDSKLLAFCDRQGLSLVVVATGKVLRNHHEPHFGRLKAVCFSPDGKWLAVGGQGWLTVYHAATGKLQAKLQEDNFQTHALHFTPDSRTLAALSLEKLILWDVLLDKKRVVPLDLKGYLEASELAPDGKFLLILCGCDILSRWRLADGKLLACQTPSETQYVKCAALSADGKRLAVWRLGDQLQVREVIGGKEYPIPIQLKGTAVVQLTADGKSVAIVNQNQWYCYRVTTGQLVHKGPLFLGEGWVLKVAPDGKTLAYGGSRVRLFNLETGQERPTEVLPSSPVRVVFFTPDGERAATASWDDRWDRSPEVYGVFWDATGRRSGQWPGAELFYRYRGPGRQDAPGVVTPQGHLLAAPTGVDTLTLWDLTSGKEVRVLHNPDMRKCLALAFAPDGAQLAALFGEAHSNDPMQLCVCSR